MEDAFGLFVLMPGITFASMPSLEFANFDRRCAAGDKISVVFFGGSLTWGAKATDPQLTSYRAVMGQKLTAAYPQAHFTFWDAAIGGTGSQLGAFRLERDVLSRQPDLVFLDFTLNDGEPDPDKLASYESLVRRMIQAGVPVLEIILPKKRDVLPNPSPRNMDAKHKEIAQAYGVPVADVVAWARKQVSEGKTTPDTLWDLPEDTTHPGDAGYALYADAVWQAYQEAVRTAAIYHVPEKMINDDTYMTLNRVALASLQPLPAGWKTGNPSRTAIAFDFTPSRWMGQEVVATLDAKTNVPSSPFRLRVSASDIFLWGESTPKSGQYIVRIDGQDSKPYDTFSKDGNLRYFQILALHLNPSVEHTIEIVPQLAPGGELRLESICVAGGSAKVSAD
jgi:lysophospholipase L1-like esterase